MAPGVLRRQAGGHHQGRPDRRGADGRSQRVDPHAAAGALPADVRRARRRAPRDQRDVRVARGARGGRAGSGWGCASARSRCRARAPSASATWCTTTRCRSIEVDPQTYEVRADGQLLPASRRRCCRWRSATFCFEHGADRPAAPDRDRARPARRRRRRRRSRLPFDDRRRSRLRARLDDGREVALLLPRGTHPARRRSAARRDGRARRRVRAAEETLSGRAPSDRAAAGAGRLPPRQPPRAAADRRGWLAYQHDHVLDDMVAELGLEVETRRAPFEPEAGGVPPRHGDATSRTEVTTMSIESPGLPEASALAAPACSSSARRCPSARSPTRRGSSRRSPRAGSPTRPRRALDARPARVELRDARSRRPGAAATRLARRRRRAASRAGAPGCSRAARRASSAPRIASWAPRWRACSTALGIGEARGLDDARPTSPTPRCSRSRPRASSVPLAAALAGLRLRVGRGASPARPCAWCRSARAPASASWPRPARAIPAAVAARARARRRRARRRGAGARHRQRAARDAVLAPLPLVIRRLGGRHR